MSRPTAAPCSSRIALLRASVSASPNECQTSACSATTRSVLRSPPPPTRTGMSRVGVGFDAAQRALMRGSAAARSAMRPPAVPNSYPNRS
ncbi:Uncharacterised protein [Mycobacteroides abscessus]|nr:Uncharacterised protein [Mycobacteroides abscessus]